MAKAKRPGTCKVCKRPYERGDEIVLIRIFKGRGKRPWWIGRHSGCHRSRSEGGPLRTWTTTGTAWRTKAKGSPMTVRYDPSIIRK